MIYATVDDKGVDWKDSLPYVEMGLRVTRHRMTNRVPSDVVFRRRPRLRWGKAIADDHNSNKYNSSQFKVGDRVMVKKNDNQGLLKPRYEGPCKIQSIYHGKQYTLVKSGKPILRNEKHLKLFKGGDNVVL